MDNQIINIDREVLGGTPVFFGTRVPIKNLFDYLETGDSIQTFLDDFEGVSKNQVIKLLEMSQKLIESSSNILNENFA
ncbi:MAG: hypothetical protein RIR12_1573 [Bacteroidota bacterium]|jgi:uncharacterized protein (DUF433 family)